MDNAIVFNMGHSIIISWPPFLIPLQLPQLFLKTCHGYMFIVDQLGLLLDEILAPLPADLITGPAEGDLLKLPLHNSTRLTYSLTHL